MPTHVLIVDDEPAITTVLMLRLQAAGYDVKHALNGLAGVEAARIERPDVIILDLRMPDIDGIEVKRRLRTDPALAHIPVIYLTAHVPADVKQRGFALDGSFYLAKPINVPDVIRAIELVAGEKHKTESRKQKTAESSHCSVSPSDP